MKNVIPSPGMAVKIAIVASLVLLAYNKVPAFAKIVGNPSKG